MKPENKASTTPENKPSAPTKPDPEFVKAAGEATLLLKAKQEMSKRMVKHIEGIVANVKFAFHLKVMLLIKSAEFMMTMAGQVAEQMTLVCKHHPTVAAEDTIKALRLQQDVLKKTTERCKAAATDAAMAQKAKIEMLNGVAKDLCAVAGDIAISMSSLAEGAAGN